MSSTPAFPSPHFLKRNQTPPLQGERGSTTTHLHAAATSETALAAAVLAVSAAAEGGAATVAAAELVLLAVASFKYVDVSLEQALAQRPGGQGVCVCVCVVVGGVEPSRVTLLRCHSLF